MSWKTFQKLYITPKDVKDPKDLARVINNLQANVEDTVKPMVQKIQNDSNFLTNITLKAANNPTAVPHLLGRVYQGCYVTPQSNANVWETPAAVNSNGNQSPNLVVWLNTSADTVVNILVW